MTHTQDPDNLQSQLFSLEELQELLLYIVTHDLRSPVMTILGFADLLAADSHREPDKLINREYIERIRAAAYRQSQIIEELQQLVRLAPNSITLESTDLSVIAQEQIKVLQSKYENTQFEIQPDCQVKCDAVLMRSALSAFLSNASILASTSSAPTVKFEIEQDPFSGQRGFRVQSNGRGFDLGADHRLLVFFRCLQSEPSLTGTGLALMQSAFIIHRHGGRLWINSDPQLGTTLSFSIPI
jgi:light-regulated signal transduction histidine kinase (bacteriophytochrome)